MDFNFDSIKDLFDSLYQWILSDVLSIGVLIQIFVLMALYAGSKLLAKPINAYLDKKEAKTYGERRAKESLKILSVSTLLCIFLWVTSAIASEAGLNGGLIQIVASLLTAWVVISFTTGFVKEPAFAKIIAVVAWGVAALNILGVLDTTIAFLDKLGFTAGETRISVLAALKTALILTATLWLAVTLSRTIEKRISSFGHIEPSLQVLFTKLVKITLIVIAVFMAMGTLGIDMSAFAVFGGAIGLGIGFGLQKVVSNLICGVILLLDRSVKPGDIIALPQDNTFGRVNRLEARCVSVLTRDGQEHLIPNEDFITQKVENWSYSSPNVRLKIPVGISYEDDPRKAMKILEEAATCDDRILKDPAPVARLVEFGASSIDMELRVWITDPDHGVINIRSNILLEIWDRFQEAGIKIPYPQRDLHIKSNESKDIAA